MQVKKSVKARCGFPPQSINNGRKGVSRFMVNELLRAAAVRLSLLTFRAEQLSRVILNERFRELYYSSSILILDQGCWLSTHIGLKSSIKEQEKVISGLPIPEISREHFNHLNTHFTKNKGHQGIQFDSALQRQEPCIGNTHQWCNPNYLASTCQLNWDGWFHGSIVWPVEFSKTIGEEWTLAVVDALEEPPKKSKGTGSIRSTPSMNAIKPWQRGATIHWKGSTCRTSWWTIEVSIWRNFWDDQSRVDFVGETGVLSNLHQWTNIAVRYNLCRIEQKWFPYKL